MDELIEDIKIVIDRGIDLDRVELKINLGTKQLSPEIAARDNYLVNSFVPDRSWRSLNYQENLQLVANIDDLGNWEVGKYIGAIEIPDRLIDPLRNIITINDKFDRHLNSYLSHPDYDSIVENISTYLQSYLLITGEIACLGVTQHQPGLVTSTVDAIRYLPNRPKVGLHLDSWQKAPLRRRHLSGNRICINVGVETRYFLFINLSVMKMAQMLGISTAMDIARYYRGIEIPDKFMATFPDYPVIKLGLAPNIAYIAPTENIIHDASSLDKQKPDFSLTFLGQFGIPKVDSNPK